MSIYLDYNATAPIDERVLETMVDSYRNHIGNPDSRTHDFGDDARKLVENARGQVANLLGINKDEVFFTSGATESNNISVLGLKEYGIQSNKKHIITTAMEHKAILGAVDHLAAEGFSVDYVKPDETGRIVLEDILSLVRDDTLLVSVMHVNNETGIIQPVKELGVALAERNVLFHIDATQSCGKLVEELRELKYDMMSIAGHKMHGPQGIGGLILRKKRYKLPPVKAIMYGGPQEHGIRPGTLPVALIAGFGKACEIAYEEYKPNNEKCKIIKQTLLKILNNSGIEYKVNGDPSWCVNNTINISFGVKSEALMLSTKRYCGLSNGSACTSSNYKLSHVLTSMGLPVERIRNAIRISWGHDTDIVKFEEDFTKFISVAKELI